MTGEVDELLRWCVAAAVDLAEAAERVGTLAAAIGADWLDGHGEEWAGRAERVGQRLDAAAGDAGHLARALSPPDGVLDPALLAALGAAVRAGRTGGPRLGGTEGARVDDEHGMRLAQMDGTDPPG